MQILPNVPTGRLSNGPRLPTIALSLPCLTSDDWGVRSTHAHSPAPGFSWPAASLAHLNGVLIVRPPSLLNVFSGPRQKRATEVSWAGTFVTEMVPRHSATPEIANHLDFNI